MMTSPRQQTSDNPVNGSGDERKLLWVKGGIQTTQQGYREAFHFVGRWVKMQLVPRVIPKGEEYL